MCEPINPGPAGHQNIHRVRLAARRKQPQELPRRGPRCSLHIPREDPCLPDLSCCSTKSFRPPTFARLSLFLDHLVCRPALHGMRPGRWSRQISALIPKALPRNNQVKWEDHLPDWTKTLIMAELAHRENRHSRKARSKAATASPLTTTRRWEVNGLWIGPVYERGRFRRGTAMKFWRRQNRTRLLAGKIDKGTNPFAGNEGRFVEQRRTCRSIRVIFEHHRPGHTPRNPRWFRPIRNSMLEKTEISGKVWGGYAFDWNNRELRSWFKNAAVEFIEKTGADGFRVDLAPDTSGYYFKEIRSELVAGAGSR